MSKIKAAYTREEIKKVLEWQWDTIAVAVARGMTPPILAQLQKNMLWDMARQFDIVLADSFSAETQAPNGHGGQPAVDTRLGAQKETTQGTLS